ncbi:MAG: ral nucleoside transport system permease protein [Baekduia sp.]|jgi:simple sugar transport system permease protein|nr:ral nucleoside transport system permease protein [Baekduia sp.]MDX6703073.1 ral nucleoside transport system permease protein [Baekduia sp.]
MSSLETMASRLRAPSGGARGGLTRARAFGWAGIALGVVAFVLTLPPFEVRTGVPSIVVGLLALACGAVAVREDEKRLGWGAVVAGVAGAIGAYGATHSGVSHLEVVVSWSALTAAMLRYAAPLTFAALGGLVSERSGVVNIALEGMMLMGAFFAAYGADRTGSWVGGLVIGVLAGMALALVHAIFAVSLRSDQIVSGTALNFVALGITGYMYVDKYGANGTPDNLPAVPDVHLPTDSLGFIGQAISQLNLLVWGSLLAVVVVWVVIFRTRLGLRLRSVGENPRAAETVGIDVYRTRYAAVIASGGLAALGGAFLSIGFVHSFSQNMTAGRGFIALAALIFGRWRPGGLLAATLLFGFSSALAQRLPEFSPQLATLFQALPYVLTLIAVAGVVGRSTPPAADGVPYTREGK